MNIAVIANDPRGEEWVNTVLSGKATASFYREPLLVDGTDVYIDLSFHPSEERIAKLKQLQPALIIVNSVIATLKELPPDFVRINGWPTFLQRTTIEASSNKEEIKTRAENIFSLLEKKTEWLPDIPGFVTARVVSMIINEAYFALDEKVSSKEEIDTAMKLGTNYPYGPFEWSEKIGLTNIYQLLLSLSALDPRYEPSYLLKQEALQA